MVVNLHVNGGKMELKEAIKELKNNNNYLKRVIEYYGVEFKGNQALCPFHNEKNKSFSIKDNKYRCFTLSCNANGDIIDFIRHKEGLTTLEATKKAFEQENGVKVNYKIVGRRDGDIATCYSDPSKAKAELGFECSKTLNDMVRDAWNFEKNYKG